MKKTFQTWRMARRIVLGSKSKRRNTSIVNHSMQTDMLRGGNISVQTEVVQRRSHGTEVF